MKKEYVTPPYSEAMKKVCEHLGKKLDELIEVQTYNGVPEKEAKINAIKYLTKDIHSEL